MVRCASCVFLTTKLRNFSQNQHSLSGFKPDNISEMRRLYFLYQLLLYIIRGAPAWFFMVHALNIGFAEWDSENAHHFFYICKQSN
jgi:hypothetical protein